MKIQDKFHLACLASALVIVTAPMTSIVFAQSAPNAEPIPYWWIHGTIEAGGRAFLNNPQKDGQAGQGGQSLAKFYEYSSPKPGPFLNGYVSTGSDDGLYRADFETKNVGYNDQKFNLDASKAGQQYFNFEWDQTPHLYSNSAQTLYNGVGTNSLTLPAGLSNQLFTDAGCTRVAGKVPAGAGCGSPLTAAQAAKVQQDITNNLHETDLGIRRDTASVTYRWTPTDAWDIKVDYSNMHRWGTQVDGIVFSPGTSGVAAQVPKPVDDHTQNFGINGEYAGSSSWGKYNVKLGYAGSVYQEGDNSYTVENPFCPTGAGPGECARTASPSSPMALMSLPPSNQANGFTGTIGAELPAKSRYMGTVSYNMMRQNDAFLPFTDSASIYTVANTTLGAVPALPGSSLNGSINTLLSNNVITTQITPELKSKLSYRYYDFDNGTPEINFPNWVLTDVKLASAQNTTYAPVNTLSVSYTKQNAGGELNWRPDHQWNFGSAYGYERYDWTRADANTTNENSGKAYADWTPVKWLTARASWLYAERRYDMYSYLTNVGTFQWPNDTGASPNTRYSAAFRQFYLDNRDRNKGQISVSVDVLSGLTLTPTFGWRLDDYNLNPSLEDGLQRDHSWDAGIEVSYLMTPYTRLLFSYTNEQHSQIIASAGQSIPPFAAASYYSANVQDRVNTFIFSVDHAFIPDKFDIKASYTVSVATDSQPIYFMNGTQPGSGAAGTQYPDVKTTWQRFEALAKYKFDKDTVERLGWKGDVTAKLRYAWERNSVANWQNDIVQTYMFATANTSGYMTWLAYDNPNYSVQLITASLSWNW